MRIMIRAAIAALSLASVPALAGEGNGEPLPFANSQPIVAQVVLSDTGSEGLPTFGGPTAIVAARGVEFPNAADAPVQTANSLPSGAQDGMPSHFYALSVQRRFTAQQQSAVRT